MQHVVVIFAGQGCQVPPDSHWEQDPQAGPLLQDQESTGPQLEVVCICDAFLVIWIRKLNFCKSVTCLLTKKIVTNGSFYYNTNRLTVL